MKTRTNDVTQLASLVLATSFVYTVSYLTPVAMASNGFVTSTYLYYYSSGSDSVADIRRPSPAVSAGLYAVDVDQREIKTDDVIDIGLPIRLFDDEHQPPCSTSEHLRKTSGQPHGNSRAASGTKLIKSISFDFARGRVLLHTRSRSEEHAYSLVAAGVCPEERTAEIGSDGECTKNGVSSGVEPNRGTKIDDVFDDAQIQPATYKIMSFAMHDGILYFVTEHADRIDGLNKRLEIELRRLRGWRHGGNPSAASSLSDDDSAADQQCGELFSPSVNRESYFNVVECSQLLAVVSRETFHRFPSNQALEGLLVVPVDDGLDFYLQLQRKRYDSSGRNLSDVSVVLYHYRLEAASHPVHHRATGEQAIQDVADLNQVDSESVTSRVAVPIHTVSLESTEYPRYILYQRGGLSLLSGTLCWTAIDRVLCGRLSLIGSVSNVETRLTPQLASTVCKGTGALANVVTGVALLEAGPPYQPNTALYFGCVAETSGMGGAGLLVIRANEAVGSVYRLRGNGSDIRAESMFIVSSAITCPPTSHNSTAHIPPAASSSSSQRQREPGTGNAGWSITLAPSKWPAFILMLFAAFMLTC